MNAFATQLEQQHLLLLPPHFTHICHTIGTATPVTVTTPFHPHLPHNWNSNTCYCYPPISPTSATQLEQQHLLLLPPHFTHICHTVGTVTPPFHPQFAVTFTSLSPFAVLLTFSHSRTLHTISRSQTDTAVTSAPPSTHCSLSAQNSQTVADSQWKCRWSCGRGCLCSCSL